VRVVFDTNVFVSALVIPSSLSEEAYRRAIMREFQLVTSVAILTELARSPWLIARMACSYRVSTSSEIWGKS
jgi:predicted nucleic acid-binding protein